MDTTGERGSRDWFQRPHKEDFFSRTSRPQETLRTTFFGRPPRGACRLGFALDPGWVAGRSTGPARLASCGPVPPSDRALPLQKEPGLLYSGGTPSRWSPLTRRAGTSPTSHTRSSARIRRGCRGASSTLPGAPCHQPERNHHAVPHPHRLSLLPFGSGSGSSPHFGSGPKDPHGHDLHQHDPRHGGWGDLSRHR